MRCRRKRRLLLAEVWRAARLCRDGEVQARLRRQLRELRRRCAGSGRDTGKRRRQSGRGVAMQRAEGAGLLLRLRRVVRFGRRALIVRRRMANRKAAKVRPGSKARRAERAGGELQIKPEDRQAGDKLTTRRRLRAKAVHKRGQCVGDTAQHSVLPGRKLRQSCAMQQAIMTLSLIRAALLRANHASRGLCGRLPEEMLARLRIEGRRRRGIDFGRFGIGGNGRRACLDRFEPAL